ncbi:MAG: hypothetical protein AB7I09_16095 [Planctomycetota bacterium]
MAFARRVFFCALARVVFLAFAFFAFALTLTVLAMALLLRALDFFILRPVFMLRRVPTVDMVVIVRRVVVLFFARLPAGMGMLNLRSQLRIVFSASLAFLQNILNVMPLFCACFQAAQHRRR